MSVLVAVVYSRTASLLDHQLDEDIRDDLADLADVADRQGLPAAAEAIGRLLDEPERRTDAYYLLVDRDGRPLAGNAPGVPTQVGWVDMPLSTRISHRGRPKDHEHVLRGRARRVADGALLYVGYDVHPMGQVTEVIVRGFAVCLVSTVVIGVALSLLTSLLVLRRVEAVGAASRAIMAGDLGRRVPVGRRGDEFDRLAAQLNAMLDRIGELVEDVRQVTNDVAHDLRTPLARLRQRLETARRKAASVADYEAAADAAIAETDAVLATFTAMLRIAQIEAGTRRAGFAPVDLSGLLAGLAETYAAVAEDRGQSLRAAVEPGVVVTGDKELLAQLFANLIENALTHTPPGSHVEVALAREGGGPVATVADDGPGVPAAMRERVLKPFVRLEASRSTPGSGLGLASVAAIARLHGLGLGLADDRPGLRVTLRFGTPAGPAPARA